MLSYWLFSHFVSLHLVVNHLNGFLIEMISTRSSPHALHKNSLFKCSRKCFQCFSCCFFFLSFFFFPFFLFNLFFSARVGLGWGNGSLNPRLDWFKSPPNCSLCTYTRSGSRLCKVRNYCALLFEM